MAVGRGRGVALVGVSARGGSGVVQCRRQQRTEGLLVALLHALPARSLGCRFARRSASRTHTHTSLPSHFLACATLGPRNSASCNDRALLRLWRYSPLLVRLLFFESASSPVEIGLSKPNS